MAVETMYELDANVWTQLTTGDCTKITVIHRGGAEVLIQPTVGANPPSASSVMGLPIKTGRHSLEDGFLNETLTDLSITASVNRVYAKPLGGKARVYFQSD